MTCIRSSANPSETEGPSSGILACMHAYGNQDNPPAVTCYTLIWLSVFAGCSDTREHRHTTPSKLSFPLHTLRFYVSASCRCLSSTLQVTSTSPGDLGAVGCRTSPCPMSQRTKSIPEEAVCIIGPGPEIGRVTCNYIYIM